MTLQIGLVLAIMALTIVLMMLDRLPPDIISLTALALLVVFGLVTPEQAFSGLGSPAVITVLAMFVLSAGLTRTGVIDLIARPLRRAVGGNEAGTVLGLMLLCGGLSALINNIAATALIMPAAIKLGRETHIPASKLLIPLAFSALLGGNMTLIGTPPNILAAAILREDNTGLTLAFFDFLPTGALVLAAGITYMALAGRHMLPSRHGEEDPVARFELPVFATEVRIPPGSPLENKTVVETDLGRRYHVTVVAVQRAGQTASSPISRCRLRADDTLMVTGTTEALNTLKQAHKVEFLPRQKLTRATLEPGKMMLAEITISPRSQLSGKTLSQINFRASHHAGVLAIWRRNHTLQYDISNIPLQFGDVLLVQAALPDLRLLAKDPNFLMLEYELQPPARTSHAPLAVLIMLGVILPASLNWLDITVAGTLGALLMVLAGILTPDEMYNAIDWRTILVIAGLLPLGTAMEQSGAGQLMVDGVLGVAGGFGPLAVLAGVYLLGMILTPMLSNAAATVILVPIAIDIAHTLGADPRPFVLATVIAISNDFLTPIGHQVNILVMGAGGYRFSDYTRVGIWLSLLIFITTVIGLPVLWPLFP